jgi:hypothetical protein
MTRIWTLTIFFIRDLFGSLAGIVPLAAALAFGIIAFEYGMDQAQFFTVGGIGIGAICLLTTLLLASRANRASSYLLVARLQRRTELLAALALGGLLVTIVLALAISGLNLLAGRLTLNFPSALYLIPTFLAAWFLAAALALPLSGLTSRGGSHVAGYLLLAALLVLNDQRAWLHKNGLDLVGRVVSTILWPVTTLFSRASAGIDDRTYLIALVATLLYGCLAFALGDQLLEDKDLLWTE